MIFINKRTMDRLALLQQMLEQNPNDSFLLFALAKEFEGRNDLQEALKYYELLVNTDADYTGVYYHLGKLQERLGLPPAQAFATYTKGMQTAQKVSDRHAYSELAAARLQLGDEDDFDV